MRRLCNQAAESRGVKEVIQGVTGPGIKAGGGVTVGAGVEVEQKKTPLTGRLKGNGDCGGLVSEAGVASGGGLAYSFAGIARR